MTAEHTESSPAAAHVPPVLASWPAVFRPCFTAPDWNRAPVLVAGKRTVSRALRVMGIADEPGFGRRFVETVFFAA